jgi:Predicted Zn-dependent proteases and their inactivated homologs
VNSSFLVCGQDSQIIAEILRSAQKVSEQAEVFWVSSRETPVQFEANHLKQIQTKESTSVALRIFREGRVGFATTTGLYLYPEGKWEDEIETLVSMAVETSQFGLPAKFQFPSSRDYPKVSVLDAKVEKIKIEKMVEFGNQLIDKITGHTPGILCDVEVTKGAGSIRLANSQGGEVSYDKSFFGLGMEGVRIQDTDMLFVGDSESSCRLVPDIDSLVADRVIRQLEMAKNKATISTRLLPVIFTPRGVASALLPPIALAFNGKTVLEGSSPLKDRVGEQVFDKKLTLWDDATVSYGIESCPCDDEGVPSQRLSLITGGVVSNFVYDLQTAALAGTQSTGNGKRAGGNSPKPTISSLIIDRGGNSFESMVEDVKEGLIVEQLIGAEQGNLLSGDFGGNVLLGYKIEKGEVVGRVKDVMISGNVYQALRELLGVGCEARWVDGILQTPPLYCSSISIATKER